MTQTPDPTPQPKSGRRLKWLLFGSLGLNLLIVGIVAGAIATGPRHGKSDARLIIDSPITMLRALDKPSRDAMREVLLSQRDGSERSARFEGMRQTQAILSLLRAESFDRAAFETILLRQSEHLATRSEMGRVALLEIVSEMSAADRAAYADRIEEILRERRDHRKGPPPSRG